jgi:hypothetical protein
VSSGSSLACARPGSLRVQNFHSRRARDGASILRRTSLQLIVRNHAPESQRTRDTGTQSKPDAGPKSSADPRSDASSQPRLEPDNLNEAQQFQRIDPQDRQLRFDVVSRAEQTIVTGMGRDAAGGQPADSGRGPGSDRQRSADRGQELVQVVRLADDLERL